MCFVCAWHTRSAFPRNTQGTRPGVCEKDFLCLLLYVWVVSSSLESANTSQLLNLLRTRARASEPPSAGEFRHTYCRRVLCPEDYKETRGSNTPPASVLLAKELQKGYFLYLAIMPLSWEEKGLGCCLLFESCFKCLKSPWNRQWTPVLFLKVKDLH